MAKSDPFVNASGNPVWRTWGDLGIGRSDDGRYLLRMPGGKVFEAFSGENGITEVTGTPQQYLKSSMRGSSGGVRGMVEEAMRTAKEGGLIRGAGKATKGRGRGKMV